MYDGHRSHETIELREAAEKAAIHLFCIPPHTSHRLQPLDVGVFGPLQRAWQKRCLRYLASTGESVTRRNVVKEYMAARTESITDELITMAWRKSGIRPLNPQVFTEADFAPSYGSSFNPQFPVFFPNEPGHLVSSTVSGPFSGAIDEANEGFEVPGVESDDVPRGGSSSMLNQMPDLEVTTNLPLLAQPTTHLPQSNETGCILREEGRGESPDQPGAQGLSPCCTQPASMHVSTVQVNTFPCPPLPRPRHYQTRSVSRSVSRSTSTQSASSERLKALEEELENAQKRNQELEASSDEWRTHCYFLSGVVTQLQNQAQTKEKRRGTQAKRIQVESRVLTSEEGRLELQHLREEIHLKEQRQAETTARKATEDDARRKRRADSERVFTGPLNKTRRKEELEDIAAALALPDSGKKDEILERISRHFEEHPDLKTTPRFEGLFGMRPRKRARLADAPVAGPSTFREPTLPPMFPPPGPPSTPFTFGPATTDSTPHEFIGFIPTPNAESPYFIPY
jgi:hypothetical protein